MTGEEALILMVGGSGGSTSSETVEIEKPTKVEYTDIDSSYGAIKEYYKEGTDEEYILPIKVVFNEKGTVNEQVNSLKFYDSEGNLKDTISFSGFYVG